MKKAILIIINLISVISLNAQQINGITGTENWFNNWTDFKPKTTEYNESTHILNGIIDTNTTLSKKNTYLLMNVVYITNNVNYRAWHNNKRRFCNLRYISSYKRSKNNCRRNSN